VYGLFGRRIVRRVKLFWPTGDLSQIYVVSDVNCYSENRLRRMVGRKPAADGRADKMGFYFDYLEVFVDEGLVCNS